MAQERLDGRGEARIQSLLRAGIQTEKDVMTGTPTLSTPGRVFSGALPH